MASRSNNLVDDSADSITDALLTASRLLVAISARSIAEIDESITFAQFRALVVVSNRGPVNLGTLASLLGVQPSAVGRMVDRLVTAGLIDRQPKPDSRRELMAELTHRGNEVVRAVMAVRREEIARVVHKMPPDQRFDLVRALTDFASAGSEPAGPLETAGDPGDRTLLEILPSPRADVRD